MSNRVFDIFAEICKVPRPSKHEEKISRWLQNFAATHGIECIADEAMNVIMRVPATPGFENHEGVILQAHMDMVCEKNGDVKHDFTKDPIETYIDGEWLKAKGTTLGADNGIGISMALAAITDPELQHPAIECLFTVDEETGLTGAMKLQDGMLRAKRLINLDSEDDGQIFIGCAGGIDTLAKMHYLPKRFADLNIPDHRPFAVKISVCGLLGGHSGDDIDKGRANANKIIVEFLNDIWKYTDFVLCSIDGGNLRNAIAREAEAVFVIDERNKEAIRITWNNYVAEVESKFGSVEKEMRLDLESCDLPETYLPFPQTARLLMALNECPHGVVNMSAEMPGLVETSTNLASVKMREDEKGRFIEINTSQRSSKEPAKHFIKNVVEHTLSIACDEVTHGDGYPGWAPNPKSELLDVVKKTYTDLFCAEPQVRAIHAGLECGLFLEKYPYLDMVSIGPQMYGVHSPQERLSIPSTERCYKWLCLILKSL